MARKSTEIFAAAVVTYRVTCACGSIPRLIVKGGNPRATVALLFTPNLTGGAAAHEMRSQPFHAQSRDKLHCLRGHTKTKTHHNPEHSTLPVLVSFLRWPMNVDQYEGGKKENTECQKQLVPHKCYTSAGRHFRNFLRRLIITLPRQTSDNCCNLKTSCGFFITDKHVLYNI